MSTGTVMIAERNQVTWLVKFLAYIELTQPRIAVMVLDCTNCLFVRNSWFSCWSRS